MFTARYGLNFDTIKGRLILVFKVAGLSPQRRWFDARSVHVRFLVNTVALGQVSLPKPLFPLSVSFNQCPTFIFIYMLLLPEGQTDEGWELPKRNALSELGEHRVGTYCRQRPNRLTGDRIVVSL